MTERNSRWWNSSEEFRGCSVAGAVRVRVRVRVRGRVRVRI